MHALKESTYSPRSDSFHTAPETGHSLLFTSLCELEVMETLHFQWQESQQEEAIPFRGKAYLVKEGQIYTWPLARKRFW